LIVNEGYLADPDGVVLVPGAAEAVARSRALGFAIVICSNQSGVARGFFDEAAVHRVNERMDRMLKEANPQAIIDRHEFCPFHPDGTVKEYARESELRKPKPGMIHRAAQMMDLALHQSWVIGDAPRDIEAGRVAGCRTILFQDPNLKKSIAAGEKLTVRPEYTCTTLKEAVDYIEHSLREDQKKPSPQPSPGVPGEGEKTEEPPPMGGAVNRLEELVGEILVELKRRGEREHKDFSVSQLLAGVVQVVVLAVLFVAYLYNQSATTVQSLLLLAVVLQVLVATMLLMSKRV